VVDLGFLASILSLLEKLGKLVAAAYRTIRSWLGGKREGAHGLPPQTIVVTRDPRIAALFFTWAKAGVRDMVHVTGDLNATNVWSKDVKVASAILRYRRTWWRLREQVHGSASVHDPNDLRYSAKNEIAPNAMTWLRVDFTFVKKPGFPERRLKADVAVIDQFNNHHWFRGLEFRHPEAMLDD